jgi:hypothetical protein
MVLAAAGDPSVAQFIRQVELTAQQIEGFIAAQPDMRAITDKMQGSTSDKPDAKIQAELESISRKHGFKDFSEYDDVATNIAMIISGIDPNTKQFTEPQAAIKKEIEQVTADKSIPAGDKKQMLDELNEAIRAAQPIQYPGNIELVKKYLDRIERTLR